MAEIRRAARHTRHLPNSQRPRVHVHGSYDDLTCGQHKFPPGSFDTIHTKEVQEKYLITGLLNVSHNHINHRLVHFLSDVT